jgi:hypothetical protein
MLLKSNIAVVVAMTLIAMPAAAQSQTDTRTKTTSTTQTTQNPDGSTTTTTTTRSRSSSGSANIDADALATSIGGLFGARPPGITAEDAAGSWQVLERWNNAERVCGVELKPEKKWGMRQARTNGCFGSMFGVTMWDVQDGAVALIKAGGVVVTKIRGDGTRLAGRAADGSPIVFYRGN